MTGMRGRGRSIAAVAAAAAFVAGSQSSLMQLRQKHPSNCATFVSVPLLGGSAGWNFGRWKSITDAVRGGVSTARLEPTPSGAKFSGHLDPSKLNAGFAGIHLDAALLPESLERMEGLQLDVVAADCFEYSVLLKLRNADKGSSYQLRFRAEPGLIDLAFCNFAAYRRGRPDAHAPALDLSQVDSLALQVASNFTSQSGTFSLEMQAIRGLGTPQATTSKLRES
eukprot:TRINITY_DN50588_c0_g1_i1.p1 TRINITY_DN50588_c0_g1~~TRINITY_DN50588_c0_g1_i1.p1  ORF type:complete len:224 (+),score=32.34 TRINITY_DN50588_c0_g1_i1:70-741(+)